MLKKCSKIFLKIILYILLLSLLFIVIDISYSIYDFASTGFCQEYTDIKHYKKALNKIRESDGISHFPNNLPKNAKEIKFYSFSGAFYHQRIFLEFRTDKNYIEQELSRLNLLPAVQLSKIKDTISIQRLENAKSEAGIDIHNYTYYAINNKRNKTYELHNEFPYYNGIGIDKEYKHIFYYFINPEG